MRFLAFSVVVLSSFSTIFCSENTFKVPSIEFSRLTNGPRDTASVEIFSSLKNVGAVAVSKIPNFAEARQNLLINWVKPFNQFPSLSCSDLSKSFDLPDHSKRTTSAAQIHTGVQGPLHYQDYASINQLTKHHIDYDTFHDLQSHCSSLAAPLRSIIDSAVVKVMKAVDENVKLLNVGPAFTAIDDNQKVKGYYHSLFNTINNGEGLEHIHTYTPNYSNISNTNNNDNSDISTLPYHVDDGLFIAMTVGQYVKKVMDDSTNSIKVEAINPPSDECGLYFQLSNGDEVKTLIDPDSLIIMMGSGARWLYNNEGIFRSLPHALITRGDPLGKQNIQRTWFGRMYLPPKDARLVFNNRPLSFDLYRRQRMDSIKHIVDTQENKNTNNPLTVVPLACELNADNMIPSRRSNVEYSSESSLSTDFSSLSVVSGQQCSTSTGEAGIYCWMQCVSTVKLPCGQQALCWDTVANISVDGTNHCPDSPITTACQLKCPNDPPVRLLAGDYCTGTGVDMIMTGFVWNSNSNQNLCVNLLFPTWTLNTQGRMVAACIGIILFAIIIEGLRVYRNSLLKFFEGDNNKNNFSLMKILVSTIVHGAQATMAYFLMLAAMTYSAELFFSVIIGLMLGHLIFALLKSQKTTDQKTLNSTEANYSHIINGKAAEMNTASATKANTSAAANGAVAASPSRFTVEDDYVSAEPCCAVTNDE